MSVYGYCIHCFRTTHVKASGLAIGIAARSCQLAQGVCGTCEGGHKDGAEK